MKKLIASILGILIAATIVYAATGYNRSEVSKEITISDKYESMEDTNITLDAPSSAAAGQTIKVSGRLTDSSGKGIADKAISVSWFGSFDLNKSYITNSEGCFQGEKEVPRYCKDKEILKATFVGD